MTSGDQDIGATQNQVVTFDDLVASPSGDGERQIVGFDELLGVEQDARDPRDVAAQAPQQARPYLGAIGAQNVYGSGPRLPGIAGVSGGFLSDGMAEAAGFLSALEQEAERRAERRPRPPGAGIMWEAYGQYERDLAPTIQRARALGLGEREAEAKPIQVPPATPSSVAAYLAGVPGRTFRRARGLTRAAAGGLAGSEQLLKKGEKELFDVELEELSSRPATETAVGGWALDAAESITTLLSGAVAGLPGALSAFGATAASKTYANLLLEGVPRSRSAAAAAAAGLLEAGTELLPAGAVIRMLGGKSAVGRAVAGFAVRELGGEAANAFGQTFAEELAKTPDMPLRDAVRVALKGTVEQMPDIVGVTAMQAAMLGGPAAAARRIKRKGFGIGDVGQERAPSAEATRAIEEMTRQQQERDAERLAEKQGTPVDVKEPWTTARRAFKEERAEDGTVVYVAPSGARITPEEWDEASQRVRRALLTPAPQEPPKPRTPTPQEILAMRPDETLVAKPAKERSELLDKLREQRKQAISADVRKELDRQIKAEERAAETRHAAEEFARMAEEETDPQRKALLWNAAANLVVKPEPRPPVPAGGIRVTEGELPTEVARTAQAEKPAPLRGITVQELPPEAFPEAQAESPQREAGAAIEAEIEQAAAGAREAERPELTDLPEPAERSVIREIAKTRKRIAELDAEVARVSGSPASTSVKSLAASERRKLRDLVAAHEMLREAKATNDKAVADKLLADASRLLEKRIDKPQDVGKKRRRLAPRSDLDETRISNSKLLRDLWLWDEAIGRRGISKAIMADIGVEEPVVKERKFVKTASGRIIQKTVPRKLAYRMGFGPEGRLFQEKGKDIDELIEAMSQMGWLPPESVMAADKATRWDNIAYDMIRREIESPGSVGKWGDESGGEAGRQIGAFEDEQRQIAEQLDREEAIALGIDVEGKSPQQIAADLQRAYARDWTGLEERDRAAYEQWAHEHGLNDRQAAQAAMVRLASEVDPDAVERAAVEFQNDDHAFLTRVAEILNEAKNQQAVQRILDDAGARLQELAQQTARPQGMAPTAAVGGAAEEGAAGREQGARAGVAAPDDEAGSAGRVAGEQRTAEGGRASGVGGTELAAVPARTAAEPVAGRRPDRTGAPSAEDELRTYERDVAQLFGKNVRASEVQIEHLTALAPRKLAALHGAKDLYARFGADLRFYVVDGAETSAGFRMKGSNRIWVNINAPYPAAAVSGHEFGHWLNEHHPDLWDDLAAHIEARADVERYRRRIESIYGSWNPSSVNQATRERARRELVSDVLGDLFADPSFHAQLMREDPSLYRKIIRRLVEFINDLLDTVLQRGSSPLESNKYVRDLQSVRAAAIRTLSALGERVDREAELLDAVRAGMEQLGLRGAADANETVSFMAVVAPPSSITVSLAENNAIEAKVFDSFNRLAEVEEAYRTQVGAPLPDEASARLAEKLFHGRVQHRANAFERDYLDPLGKQLKRLKKVGLTIRDADDYLMALHAPERNATLRARDPHGRDGLSGITDADARTIIASFSPEQIDVLEGVRREVRRVIDFRIDALVEGGLIKKEAAEYLRKRWPNYVPLKTVDTESRHLGVGVGFEMWANDIRVAFGRTTRASTPIGFALSDAVRAIVRAEKARVERAIWRQANTPELAEIIRPYDPDNPPPEVMSKKLDQKTGQVVSVLDPSKYDAHVMSLVIDGEQKRVFVADETLRRQFARAGEFEDVGALLDGIGYLTRTLGRTLTEWNPNWFLPNAVKDAIAASIRAIGIEGVSVARILAEIPRSWKHILEHKLGMRTLGARLYEEFSAAGGITGAYGIESPQDFLKKLVRRGADVGYMYGDRSVIDKMTDPLRALLHGISVANEVVEYATRFAAYKAARQAGYSIDRSAEIAKEITVNFNRRGEIGRSFGSLYVFFNAALQGVYGTAKFFGVGRSVVQPGAVEHKKVIAGAAALMTIGAVMQAINEFVGGDDEETGDKVVNGHSDFILDHNISLVGLGEKGIGIAKIPLPPEYSAFYAIGRRLYRAASQGNYAKEAAGIAGNILDSALPVRVADETAAPLAAFKAMLPSVLTPVAEVATNTNFLGAAIVPDPIGSGPTPPYYTISRPSTSKLAKSLSQVLNDATGGDPARPGAAQKVLGPFVSPEAMEHLVRAYTGGLGQTVLQARNVASAALTGSAEDVELGKLPVIPRFYAHRPPSYVERKYREIADVVQQEKRARRMSLPPKDQAALDVEQHYNSAERALMPLYRQFRDASEAGDRERAKQIREHVLAIKSGVVRAYNAARAGERAQGDR